MRSTLQDLKHTRRLWSNRPWQTAFAVTALAIGIGASTGVFGVVNALLLRSLPFRDPDRLALFRDFIPPHDSVREFHAWRQHTSYLVDAALFEENDVNLGGPHIASRVHVVQTSWNFFSVLGIQPVLGRAFASGDDIDGTGWGSPGPNSEAVVGYGLWQQLFGGQPNILGATIQIDGKPLTVVGVAPPGFDYPGNAVLWKPAAFSLGNNGWGTVVRLRPDISWPQARAAFELEVARLSPERSVDSSRVHPLLFMGAVLVVLLISCMNVANLLLARNADRAAEFSIRSALGASRIRLARQLFTESLLLSLLAALLGFAIAHSITSFAARMEPPPLGMQFYSLVDRRVFAFTLAISLFTALVFGVVPSLYRSRLTAFTVRSGHTIRSSRLLGECLVAGQVMLTMILLAGSVSLGRAFIHLIKIDRGYDVQRIVTVNISLDGTTHQSENARLPYFENLLDRIRRLPGVRSASATEFLPLYASSFVGGTFELDHRPAALGSTMIPVLSGYFRTMGARILFGREFTDAEVRSGTRVAVVNERFAAGFGPAQDAIGHQLTIGNDSWQVVGIVRGMEYETDPTTAGGNQVFVPSTTPGGFFSTFVVRVNGRAEDYLASIRDTIQSVDPTVPVFGAKTMEQRLNEFFAHPKFYRTAIWFFAGFTILLALLGIYAIVSQTVVQRNQEMGVRMALGRTSVQLRGMLLQRGLLTVAAGAFPGIAGAQLSGRFLGSLTDGAKPVGLTMSGGLVLLFALIASASIWAASRRLATHDVVSVLRSE
jgi:putative ABC transport system permease protein